MLTNRWCSLTDFDIAILNLTCKMPYKETTNGASIRLDQSPVKLVTDTTSAGTQEHPDVKFKDADGDLFYTRAHHVDVYE